MSDTEVKEVDSDFREEWPELDLYRDHRFGDNFQDVTNLQNVFTPHKLVKNIVDKLEEYTTLSEKTFLVFNHEFALYLLLKRMVPKENIFFLTDSPLKGKWANVRGINVIVQNFDQFLQGETVMGMPRKFDCIVMNPPYQTKSDKSNSKTQSIWDKFVEKSVSILVEGGFLGAIHPSGWRNNSDKTFKNAQVLKQKQIKYLEIHDEQDGLKTFGATTRYDWYILQNKEKEQATDILGQDGILTNSELMNFIPNSMLAKNYSFLAKDQQGTVEIITDSGYHTQREHLSKEKTETHIYPIVYSTPVAGPTIWYSSTKENGHFGISKLIINPCRPIGFVIDEKGEYGMSQFCVGIVGDKKYLDMVAGVIKNQKTNGFAEFMESTHFTDKILNKDIISLFRKDFWKEFI